jgi:HJR/Mrr/RecB family endonuclease
MVVVVCIIGIVFLLYIVSTKHQQLAKQVEQEARRLIVNHIGALRLKRLQKRKLDEYGNLVDTQWNKEINYFYDNVLFPTLSPRYGVKKSYVNNRKTVTEIGHLSKDSINAVINEEVDKYSDESSITSVDVDTLSPVAFESFCAGVLIENGWSATTTKGSGDQGIDIIATQNGKKAVFQCKKFSSPVGNKAVQEIIAGKSYESADYAFVVSNAEYTQAATELANKSGVILLHYSRLPEIANLAQLG